MRFKAFKIAYCIIGIITITSCNVYSILSFNNQSTNSIYLKYVQENGKVMEQEIKAKNELNMMFDKKWTDKNIRTVVGNIKEIVLYTSTDTIFQTHDKDVIYKIFKENRTQPFKDKISLKLTDL